MENYRNISKCLIVSTITAFAVSSIAIACIPLMDVIPAGVSKIITYIIGAIFWIGLLAGIGLSAYSKTALYRPRRYFQMHHLIHRRRYPGIAYFDLTVPKIALYALCVVGLILIVCDLIFQFIPGMVMFPVIAATIFAFELHCIVDGVNYKIYKLLKEGIEDEN